MSQTSLFYIRLPSLLAILAAGILVFSSIIGAPAAKIDTADVSAPGAMLEPELNAHAYIVQIIGSPKPLIQKRAWKHMAPASLTKLMSAAIAEEELGREEQIPFSADAKATEEKTTDAAQNEMFKRDDVKIGRASCRERVCQYV